MVTRVTWGHLLDDVHMLAAVLRQLLHLDLEEEEEENSY
jgi:hypothetical protein